METLFIVVDNPQKRKPSYTLYKLSSDGKHLTPLGFEGLGTDYPEIQKFKKWNMKTHTFVFESKEMTFFPRDIIYALRDRFENVQMLNANYAGYNLDTVKGICNCYSDSFNY